MKIVMPRMQFQFYLLKQRSAVTYKRDFFTQFQIDHCNELVYTLKKTVAVKGAVSRNSVKLVNYKMPVKSKRNIKITA